MPTPSAPTNRRPETWKRVEPVEPVEPFNSKIDAYEAAFPALPKAKPAAAAKSRPTCLVSERLDAYDQSLGRRVVAYRNSPEGRVKIEAAREKHNALYLTLLGFQFAEVEQDAEDGSITEGEFLVYVT